MDGQDGFVGKELIFYPCNLLMVFEVVGHLCMVKAFQMTSGDHTGRNGTGGVIHEFIEQVILAREDNGQERLGVMVELSEGLELGQDFKAQEIGLVDNEHGDLFSLSDFHDQGADGSGDFGDGV